MDIVRIEPNPTFDARTGITSEEIPDLDMQSRVGVGAARSLEYTFVANQTNASQPS